MRYKCKFLGLVEEAGQCFDFFYGASKGNPGREGAGGVIYSADGKRVDSFNCGLGHKTNNHAKTLALLKVC